MSRKFDDFLKEQLTDPEIRKEYEALQPEHLYDFFMFMGQSNMAGRGITSKRWTESAPDVIWDAGFEYRAVSDPEKLYPIVEPFGVDENNPEGIFEQGMKTGSMVSAFVNAYFIETEIPIIGVSAAKGGSAIGEWQGNKDYLSDAIGRFKKAFEYFKENEILIRHKFMLWCQGETDGDLGTDPDEYKAEFKNMFHQMKEAGIEKCFLITIGEYNGEENYDYTPIRSAQLELCEEIPDVILVGDDFYKMKAIGLMKDDFHYFQRAYNEVGRIAGKNAGEYIKANR